MHSTRAYADRMDVLEVTSEIVQGFGVGLMIWVAAWGAQVMFTAFRAVADPGDPDIG